MIRKLVLALLAVSTLALSFAGEGEFITRAEFNKFLEEYNKNKSEAEQLRTQNAGLVEQVKQLETATAHVKLASKIDGYLGPEGKTGERQEASTTSSRSGTTKLLITGWADSGFEYRRGRPSTFTSSFHPIFLWKLSDRLSFESDLTYQVISYHFDDHATLEAGKFLTPFGAFIRRQHQTWSNKLPDDPLALDINTGLVPSYTVGAMVSGAVEAPCDTRFTYSAYVGNGPRLSTTNPADFGTLSFNNDIDNNRSKAVGGRLGFLPNADLDLGISFQTSRVGERHTPQAGVDATLFGADVSYTNDFDALKGTVDIKGEWVWSRVDDANYTIAGNDFFFSDDHRNGGYAQVSYRPTQLNHKWLRNFEIALRYDRLDNPNRGPVLPGTIQRNFIDHDRLSLGLDYWLAPSAVVKFAYETDRGKDRSYLLQFAVGF